MKYFTFKELCKSDTATKNKLANVPTTTEVMDNLVALVENVLDPLRTIFGKPITVNSGYRGKTLNKMVGGVANSQHLTGQAADICGKTRDETLELGRLLETHELPFDQLIYEGTWLHVSHAKNPRRMVMRK